MNLIPLLKNTDLKPRPKNDWQKAELIFARRKKCYAVLCVDQYGVVDCIHLHESPITAQRNMKPNYIMITFSIPVNVKSIYCFVYYLQNGDKRISTHENLDDSKAERNMLSGDGFGTSAIYHIGIGA